NDSSKCRGHLGVAGEGEPARDLFPMLRDEGERFSSERVEKWTGQAERPLAVVAERIEAHNPGTPPKVDAPVVADHDELIGLLAALEAGKETGRPGRALGHEQEFKIDRLNAQPAPCPGAQAALIVVEDTEASHHMFSRWSG